MNNTGWICPRCGKVNAPDIKQCSCSGDGYFPYPIYSTPYYPVPHKPWWEPPYTVTYICGCSNNFDSQSSGSAYA